MGHCRLWSPPFLPRSQPASWSLFDTLVPVTTTSPEEVMPFATSLAAEHRLNLLVAEAAATAVLYECAIHVSIDGDNPLRRVAAELGIEYHVTTCKRPPEKRDRQA